MDSFSFDQKSLVRHTPVLYNIIAFSIAATCAFALSPLLFPLAEKISAIDIPSDARRMHKKPIPRIGGLAVFFGFLTATLFEISLPIAAGGLVIISIGIVDDVYRINAYQKLIFQIIAAAVAIAFGARFPTENRSLSIEVAFLWLVILPNAFNLIDGLDGLCSRVAIFSALALFFMGGPIASVALAGALVGFLPYNLRYARMFLGDTGSLFVGFALGVISLETMSNMTLEKGYFSFLLIFFLPLADTAFAFVRRIARGKNPFSSDREHFHHKLVDRGFSHREASLLLSLAALALSAVGVALER